jgi:hypothetical protein
VEKEKKNNNEEDTGVLDIVLARAEPQPHQDQ